LLRIHAAIDSYNSWSLETTITIPVLCWDGQERHRDRNAKLHWGQPARAIAAD
jgi:DNA/RNA-binding domain of Phe-tRNA-synthetase-like protein